MRKMCRFLLMLIIHCRSYPVRIIFIKCHIPCEAILNVAFVRDKNYKPNLGSVLLSLTKEDIKNLSNHYICERVIYRTKICSLCATNFKIYSCEDNCGFIGCTYNPTYYNVIPAEDLQFHHVFGCQKEIDSMIENLDFDKSKMFYVDMHGHYSGLYLSKFPLPDDWNKGTIICWNCMRQK